MIRVIDLDQSDDGEAENVSGWRAVEFIYRHDRPFVAVFAG